MQTYIALLRGINVGGQKKIKMADLRTHLSELAYADIRTYIQSGNIVFSSPLREIPALEAQIKEKIQEKYGVSKEKAEDAIEQWKDKLNS